MQLVDLRTLRKDDWQEIVKLLEKGVNAECDQTVESLVQDILMGYVDLWMTKGPSICITRLHDRPRRRVLIIEWIIGVNWKSWVKELETTLNEYARLHECGRIEAHTFRPGMKKYAQAFEDYKPIYTTYRKDIE